VFPKLEEFIHEISESKGDKKILEEAETIEKRSNEFYKKSVRGILNKNYQNIFDILIEEEEGHLNLIMQMSDYMTLHGVWSGLEEYFVNWGGKEPDLALFTTSFLGAFRPYHPYQEAFRRPYQEAFRLLHRPY
jgi:hypothetical protein